jgi:signal transduction histidine kinase
MIQPPSLDRARRAVVDALPEAVLVFDAAGATVMTNRSADALFSRRPVRSYGDFLSRFDIPPELDQSGGPVEAHLGHRRGRVAIQVIDVPVNRERAIVLRDEAGPSAEPVAHEAFLDVLSHELRTPITTVYAGSTVLAQDDRLPPDVRRELAQDVASEADRLFRIVEDLLVLARLDRGELDLAREPVLVQRIVTDTIRIERRRWPSVTLVPTLPTGLPAVAGDPRAVAHVVRNLVANGARNANPGGQVEVVLEGGSDGVTVRILDRGRESTEAAGAGVGLFVCRRLVAAMGGRTWGGPRSGEGSDYGFSLPCYVEDEPAGS